MYCIWKYIISFPPLIPLISWPCSIIYPLLFHLQFLVCSSFSLSIYKQAQFPQLIIQWKPLTSFVIHSFASLPKFAKKVVTFAASTFSLPISNLNYFPHLIYCFYQSMKITLLKIFKIVSKLNFFPPPRLIFYAYFCEWSINLLDTQVANNDTSMSVKLLPFGFSLPFLLPFSTWSHYLLPSYFSGLLISLLACSVLLFNLFYNKL